jgi:hypothetical protein
VVRWLAFKMRVSVWSGMCESGLVRCLDPVRASFRCPSKPPRSPALGTPSPRLAPLPCLALPPPVSQSCDPNLRIEAVLDERNSEQLYRLGLYASKFIPALTELCYRYGCVDCARLTSAYVCEGGGGTQPDHCTLRWSARHVRACVGAPVSST